MIPFPGLTYTFSDLSRFLQMPANCLLVKIFPLSVFRLYIRTLGFIYFTLNSRDRAAVSHSIRKKLNADSAGISPNFMFNVYTGILEHYFEKMVMAHRSLSETKNYLARRVTIDNRPWLDRIRDRKSGCLFISGHFGAVEYLPTFLAMNGYRPTMIVRFKTQKLREALIEKTTFLDLVLIDADLDNVARHAILALKQGRTLVTLCDEFKHWRPSERTSISIFGEHLPRDRTLDIIYHRAKVPACLGVMRREKKNHILHIEPVADGNEKTSVSHRSWNLLENYIHRYPEQWYQWQDVAQGLENYKLKGKK